MVSDLGLDYRHSGGEAGNMQRDVWGVFPGVCCTPGSFFTPLLEVWRLSQAGLIPDWGVLGTLDPSGGDVAAIVICGWLLECTLELGFLGHTLRNHGLMCCPGVSGCAEAVGGLPGP